MTETSIPNGLPRLAMGSYERGEGKACIMNAISYLNGDKDITDMPDCVDMMLSLAAQKVNDLICPQDHRKTGPYGITIDELCPECSHKMWMLGSWLIGTGELQRNNAQVADKVRVAVAFQFRAWVTQQIPELASINTSGPVDGMVLALFHGISKQDMPDEYKSAFMTGALRELVDIFYEVSGMNRQPRVWTEADYQTVATEMRVPVAQ